MKIVNDLKTDNWYYGQSFGKHVDGDGQVTFDHLYTIVFADSKMEALKKLEPWLKVHGSYSITLYHKNYVREARRMVTEGNYID